MTKANFKKWFQKAGVRAIRTFAQALGGYMTGAALFSQIDWKTAISASLFSVLFTFVMALAGLPELKD